MRGRLSHQALSFEAKHSCPDSGCPGSPCLWRWLTPGTSWGSSWLTLGSLNFFCVVVSPKSVVFYCCASILVSVPPFACSSLHVHPSCASVGVMNCREHLADGGRGSLIWKIRSYLLFTLFFNVLDFAFQTRGIYLSFSVKCLLFLALVALVSAFVQVLWVNDHVLSHIQLPSGEVGRIWETKVVWVTMTCLALEMRHSLPSVHGLHWASIGNLRTCGSPSLFQSHTAVQKSNKIMHLKLQNAMKIQDREFNYFQDKISCGSKYGSVCEKLTHLVEGEKPEEFRGNFSSL